MNTTYRVTYPLITQDGSKDFTTRKEADEFAATMRNNPRNEHMWRHVRVAEITK